MKNHATTSVRPSPLELARRAATATAEAQDNGGHGNNSGTPQGAEFYQRLELDAPPAEALEFLRDELGLPEGPALSAYPAICENLHLFQSARKKSAGNGTGAPVATLPDDGFKQLTVLLMKIMEAAAVSANPKLTLYAGLHAHDVELFDMLNQFQNMESFAATVRVPKENLVMHRPTGFSVRTVTWEPLTKAAVNNAVLDLQKKWKLPPRKDQRPPETRETQSKVRKGQLKK